MSSTKIDTSEAKVGMILAEPIMDKQGRVIISEGSRLTPVLVKRLSRWGVEEIFIDADADEKDSSGAADDEGEGTPTVQLDQEYMRELAVTFNERFHEVEDNPVMEQLKKLSFKIVVLAGRNGLPGVR